MFYRKKRRYKKALRELGGILAQEFDKSRPFRKHFEKIGMDKTIRSIMFKATAPRNNWFKRAWLYIKLKRKLK